MKYDIDLVHEKIKRINRIASNVFSVKVRRQDDRVYSILECAVCERLGGNCYQITDYMRLRDCCFYLDGMFEVFSKM